MFRGSRRLSDDLFFITLVVLAVLKTALARYFILGQSNPLPAFLLETAIIVVVLGVVDLIPSRRRYLLTLGAYAFISALLVTMTVYVSFYAQLFDPRMMAVAGQLGTVTDAVGAMIKPIYLLFFIDIPFLAWWAIALGRADKQRMEAVQATAEAVEAGDGLPKRTVLNYRAPGRSRLGRRRARGVAARACGAVGSRASAPG